MSKKNIPFTSKKPLKDSKNTLHCFKCRKKITLNEYVSSNVNPKKSIYVLPFVLNICTSFIVLCNLIFKNWSYVVGPKLTTQYLTTALSSRQYVHKIKKTCLQLNCEQNKCQTIYNILNSIESKKAKKEIKTLISQTSYLQINKIKTCYYKNI